MFQKVQPSSVAGTKKPYIVDYIAPESCGGGQVRISLRGEHPHWDEKMGIKNVRAVLALNAGIDSYSSWVMVLGACTICNIPFAVTDIESTILGQQKKTTIRRMLNFVQPVTALGSTRVAQWSGEHREIVMNPFHRPGQLPRGRRRTYSIMIMR